MILKKGIFLASLICSFSAAALADEVNPQIIASVHDVDQTIQKVDLREDGKMFVVTKQDRIIEKQLSNFTLTKLRGMMMDVSEHWLVTEKRTMICKMLQTNHPMLLISRLENSDKIGLPTAFVGEPRVMLSDDRCSEVEVIRPDSAASYRDAQELRDLFMVLGHEILNPPRSSN